MKKITVIYTLIPHGVKVSQRFLYPNYPKQLFIITVFQGEKQKFKDQSQPVETLDSK